jgi:hypothetical protein
MAGASTVKDEGTNHALLAEGSTMRRSMIALALLAAASPLYAQTKQQGHENDPTQKVAGGVSVPGWKARLDDKDTKEYKVTDTKMVAMGPGFHVTSGPAAIYYDPKNAQKNAPFTISATFGQRVAPKYPEAYGLFLGGKELDDAAKQTYVYFLVRGTGEYFIAHRAGAEVHKIVNWTKSDAVKVQDDKGAATNALSVAAGPDSVRFFVNGTQVHAITRTEISDVSGDAGLRVNHNLNVHVAGFGIKPGAK